MSRLVEIYVNNSWFFKYFVRLVNLCGPPFYCSYIYTSKSCSIEHVGKDIWIILSILSLLYNLWSQLSMLNMKKDIHYMYYPCAQITRSISFWTTDWIILRPYTFIIYNDNFISMLLQGSVFYSVFTIMLSNCQFLYIYLQCRSTVIFYHKNFY